MIGSRRHTTWQCCAPLRRCRRNGAAETEWVVLVMVYMVAQKAIQVGRNYFFFFGTVFALINVKVMNFIRFVRVKFAQRAFIIIFVLVRAPSAKWDLVLGTAWCFRCWLPSCRVFTFFRDLIDVHNVICSHQAEWAMELEGHLLGGRNNNAGRDSVRPCDKEHK